ncbi:MAG: alpha/beta hydrolase [Bacteroides sp.]|nr:alpha/beta hydrolase [Bacteroides sp.]
MKSVNIFLLFVLLLPLQAAAGLWTSDAADTDSTYFRRTVVHPDDYSGKVVSTIIRKGTPDASKPGVLYVHGFNDYFFNTEMGDEFARQGYNFYAVDLRKYGRSILHGQKRYEALSLEEYFPDIDSALVDMERAGIDRIVLMGHSTGGLITALYMSRSRSEAKNSVDTLILNSPFLDWNQGWKEKIIGAVSWVGKWFPNLKISQGESTAYAESLLADHHGRWHYDTTKKLSQSPPVTAGWIRAITEAQKALRDGKADIKVPILLMYSGASVDGSEWTEEHNLADGVLDVNDIKKYGLELGPHVTCIRVIGGLHDLTLSSRGIVIPLYRRIFSWLSAIPALEEPEELDAAA